MFLISLPELRHTYLYFSQSVPSHHTPLPGLTLIFLSLKSSLWPVSFSSSQSILLSWLTVPTL